ncbi:MULTISPECIES: PTS ascorbate transporter subunit IIC [unclassified Streptomyces]|uniref:PTS ascorbate transporter subunit IIC n=1 Tax=unclassified Streptomyces TaxID=2593676 RepID=UPI000890C176|nr:MULTISPECIES: PTS ascorbate transporter subunit IIC [unclassified Streptomyces]PBC85575.1 PTS system IIC component (L-Asc family) [Streptomyces sp. 2321.6]SDR11550.1 PTS system IIC component, L-Asc family [Streptomyces sp. KS_16]SED72393.1 PTS system IIC component, L-Asc family [Streptomyces sp. 2133.1]SEE08682.1 PTS system IIC component, L-Asc family [Streptomyces sp. 2112.3]SNC72166.1 PTS system, ascorbate-specific IIC component [Streptomyces sp. 2114.4]
MDWLIPLATFLVNEILSQPAYLVGLITAAGLIALKKTAGQVVGGAIKATLGFLLIGAGAGLVVSSLGPLGGMIHGATGAHGVIPTNEAIVGIAQARFGARVAWLMILGFAVALMLARFTPLRYVFLTGHHMLFMATLLTIVLAPSGRSSVSVVVVGGLLLGILLVAMPAFAHPWTKRITGNNSIAIGHFGTAGYVVAGAAGQLVGKRSRSTEDMKLPEGLRFLRDSMVATALSMVLIYVIMSLAYLARVGRATAFKSFAAGGGSAAGDLGNYVMQSVMQGLQFGIAVAVILFGVRTILGELVPAFQGIAGKLVPGAVPSLDAPIVFPYAQNAVLIGFLASFAGGLVSLALLAWVGHPALGLALVLPGLVPHFFTGGAAGVYGNATGGRRGAAVGAFLNGVLITFLPALLLKVLGAFGKENTTFGDADFGWFGTLIGTAARAGGTAGILVMPALGAVLLGAAILFQKRVVDTGWDPGARRDAFLPGAASAASAATLSSGTAAASAPVPVPGHAKIAPPAGAPAPPPPPATG